MLLTLTPNPSLDLLFEHDRLAWDDANRVDAPRVRAGGQGINLVRAARELGGRALAIVPLGGVVGDQLRSLLEAEGAPLRAVPIDGDTRVFVGVRETGSGRSLLLNPRGPVLGDDSAKALAAAVDAELKAAQVDWLACCGSLTRGLPPDFYARLGRRARASGTRFVPDCDGEPLTLAAEAGCDLLVPNIHEAERLLGRRIHGVGGAADAARALLRYGCPTAVVTLGADGAVAASADGAWHARPPAEPGSAVGAGDAFLAALLLALDEAPLPDALRAAVAAGTAVLRSRGASLLARAEAAVILDAVSLKSVD